MIGGMVSSSILTLFVIPAIYAIGKAARLSPSGVTLRPCNSHRRNSPKMRDGFIWGMGLWHLAGARREPICRRLRITAKTGTINFGLGTVIADHPTFHFFGHGFTELTA